MARPKPALKVIVAPEAASDLAEIWRWNAERYSPDHADRYVDLLKQVIYGLDVAHLRGKPVARRPDLRFVLVRRKSRGYGHLVVFRINDVTVDVLHVFHSAQDWPTELSDEDLTEESGASKPLIK